MQINVLSYLVMQRLIVTQASIDYYTTSSHIPLIHMSNKTTLSILRLYKISEGLWLAFKVVHSVVIRTMAVAVVVGMWVLRWANVFHLQDITTFRAALDRAIARHL